MTAQTNNPFHSIQATQLLPDHGKGVDHCQTSCLLALFHCQVVSQLSLKG
jgi:hypothetical protein